MTELDKIALELAHRRATRYRHRDEQGVTTYGFTEAHLLDFVHELVAKLTEGQEPSGWLLTGSRVYEDSVVKHESWADERIANRGGKDGTTKHPLYLHPPLIADLEAGTYKDSSRVVPNRFGIGQPYAIDEILRMYDSHEYSAELLLQHALIWLTAGGAAPILGTIQAEESDEEFARQVEATYCNGRAAPAVPEGWQPIETAPKDGTLIIVCGDTGNVWCDVKWEKRPRAGERWEHLTLGALRFAPTHWMPLPAAPQPHAPAVPATCTWRCEDDIDMPNTWDGECGAKWSFVEGGPSENNMRYCPECGKPLQIAERSNEGTCYYPNNREPIGNSEKGGQ